MSENDFELDDLTAIAVATMGPPGQRQFFLQARSGERTVTVACEKVQIQLLLARLQQLLAAQDLPASDLPGEGGVTYQAVEPLEPLWSVAELGLGYHEGRRQFVIVAREAGESEAATTVRFWLDLDQVRGFARQAETVLTAGRALCRRCGLPIDPAGHPCPAANGSRPIF